VAIAHPLSQLLKFPAKRRQALNASDAGDNGRGDESKPAPAPLNAASKNSGTKRFEETMHWTVRAMQSFSRSAAHPMRRSVFDDLQLI
jgi:hypothetical protein